MLLGKTTALVNMIMITMTVDAGITEAIDGTVVTRSAQTPEMAVIYGSTKKILACGGAIT
jgi:hypothetical protein